MVSFKRLNIPLIATAFWEHVIGLLVIQSELSFQEHSSWKQYVFIGKSQHGQMSRLCVKHRPGSAKACRAGLPGSTCIASCGFSVSGIITLYLYPPETECVGPDQSARSAQADLGQYITQRPYCLFSRGRLKLLKCISGGFSFLL